MSNVYSTSVSIFPLAKNREVDKRASRLLYEDNIANLIRQVVDTEGFIIQEDNIQCSVEKKNGKYEVNFSGTLIFNLFGYYVRLDSGSAWLSTAITVDDTGVHSIYAQIQIKDDEIFGQDENGVYSGITLSTALNSDYKNLLLGKFEIDKTDDSLVTWTTDEDAKQKFTLNSFKSSIKFIDGKHQ